MPRGGGALGTRHRIKRVKMYDCVDPGLRHRNTPYRCPWPARVPPGDDDWMPGAPQDHTLSLAIHLPDTFGGTAEVKSRRYLLAAVFRALEDRERYKNPAYHQQMRYPYITKIMYG